MIDAETRANRPAEATRNTESTGTLHVRIAVLTYKRPDDIAAALPRLLAQAESVGDVGTRADIVVGDNDPEGGAREVVESFAAEHADVPVIYENETTPGIAAARNRALDTAAEVDLLVFIDDAERPSDRWLALLLQTYREHRSAAVVGSVISEYEVEPDAWVQSGRFFDRRRLPTGSKLDVAATNNLLLDMHQIRSHRLIFDEQFGLTGGSDTMFTRTLHRLGGELIWCDEAVVVDVVPAARVTRDWVLRRAFRSGSSWSATSLKLADSRLQRLATKLRLTGRGSVRIAGGAARLAAGTVGRSQGQRARGQRTIARGAGMLSGAWGYVYSEYKRG
jgi:glycosyltransferase involved in cell wall biosynthesis